MNATPRSADTKHNPFTHIQMTDFDHRYDDLLDTPRPEPQRHPRMPMADRAAQFAPFAALTGFKELLDRVAATHLASQPSMYASPDPDLSTDPDLNTP